MLPHSGLFSSCDGEPVPLPVCDFPWFQGSSTRPKQQFTFLSWNCRTLIHHNKRLRKTKESFFRSISSGKDVICLQEVHGNLLTMRAYFQHWQPTHEVLCSAHASSDTGGIVTMIARAALPLGSRCELEELIRGRISISHVISPKVGLAIINVHNHDLESCEIEVLRGRVSQLSNKAAREPHSFGFMLLGDCNIAIGDSVDMSQPHISEQTQASQNRDMFNSILQSLIELTPTAFSHFYSASNKLNTIDRCFLGSPSWFLTLLDCQGECGDPWECHQKQLSDHAPVTVRFSLGHQCSSHSLPIPSHVCRCPQFATAQAEKIDHVDPFSRLQFHKEIIREAAIVSRQNLSRSDPDNPRQLAMTFGTLSRCVFWNDTTLAQRMINRSAVAARYIQVVGDKVSAIDPTAFANAFTSAKYNSLNIRRQELASEVSNSSGSRCNSKFNFGRNNCIRRLSKLWLSSGRRMFLKGIRDAHTGEVHSSGQSLASLLTSSWEPIFNAIPKFEDEATAFVDRHLQHWDFSKVKPVSSMSYLRFLQRT